MSARILAGDKPLRSRGLFAFLLSMQGVLIFWIAYGLIHAIFRFNASRTLSLDDARATELAQHFSIGYQTRQPPLYEWLLWCAQQVFGTGIASDLFVRYSLIALLGLACFGAARAALKSERWAAAASLSLAASYPVGWSFHEWGTQTILLCIACFATLHAAIIWLEKPSARAAIWLGAAVGLGLLSKFSYPLFICALLLACASMKETRHRLADSRLLLSVAVALAMISPYLFWLLKVRGDIAAAVDAAIVPYGKPYLRRMLAGLARLVKSIPLFLLPWLAFLVLLTPQAFRYDERGASKASVAERLALHTMVIAAALAALTIILLGAANIAERYMHPILVIAPVYVFARIRRFDPDEASLRPLMMLIMAAAAAVFCIRIAAVSDNGFTHRADRPSQIPYQPLAEALEARGIGSGTVVTFDVREAGNLRAFLPGLRVIAADSYRVTRSPRRASDDRSCVLLYSKMQTSEKNKLAPFGSLEPERIDVAAPPSRLGASRQGTWWVARLDPQSAACR
jgi:hypothetical protein